MNLNTKFTVVDMGSFLQKRQLIAVVLERKENDRLMSTTLKKFTNDEGL